MNKAPLFQVLDTKQDCAGYFANNMIDATSGLPLEGETWEYSAHLPGSEYELGRIYASGATLTQACPLGLRKEWDAIKATLKAHLKAFKTARLSLEKNCLYDVLPEYFLFRYLNAKNQITRHVLDTYRRPANYNFMYNLVEMLSTIREQELSIGITPIQHLLSSVRGQNFQRMLSTAKPVCDYNPWGTITGRLATNPNTFPILTMNKEFRRCVKPKNDWLVELDFNAAELRVLLALAGNEQPSIDIHDWNVRNIFKGELTREQAKTKTFAWLYSQRVNKELEALYNKVIVKNKYWDGFKIETDYGRIIEDVDEHHALNYIVQSTTIDMVHEQAYKAYELLKGRRSHISFLIHDAVYIDLAEEDRYELLNLLDTFKKTRYDMFKVNVSAGRNLGEMKELRL
tara:strand:+ start:68 stop:1267 length:1200 start_codon:yes stop_codon:yes gene_type:complete